MWVRAALRLFLVVSVVFASFIFFVVRVLFVFLVSIFVVAAFLFKHLTQERAIFGDLDLIFLLAEFDFWLRQDGHRRNPGTSADLVAAGLFVSLQDGKITNKG